jgi:hypothetical protein
MPRSVREYLQHILWGVVINKAPLLSRQAKQMIEQEAD